ncbi:MAG: GNAT family N-acetyltransferase [Ardenticatenaceae bacterium]
MTSAAFTANTLLFRQATRDDLSEIVRLLADDDLGQQREQYQYDLPHAYYQAFEAIERDLHNELIVVESEGRIVGTFQLTFIPSLTFQGGKRAQIEGVRVARGVQGQGIGRAMIEWAIARARQAGCCLVQLTTNKQRADAIHFYTRLGFAPSHEGMKLYLSTAQQE